MLERILQKRRGELPGVPLEPRDEPIPLLERLALAHDDLMLLALRAWPGSPRRVPAEQTTEQTSHRDIT